MSHLEKQILPLPGVGMAALCTPSTEGERADDSTVHFGAAAAPN